jgi:acyl-CoA dehydrogenase
MDDLGVVSGSASRSAHLGEEHEMLRAQIRRFVDTEIKPHALAWEEQGFVPREVLRRMGELGFLGIRYPEEYGGSGMDTLATVVLAEELGRSTFAGVAITVLVHTDMASVHLFNAGSEAPEGTVDAGGGRGGKDRRRGRHRAGAGSDVKAIRTTARRDGDCLRPQRDQDLHHQRRPRRPLLRRGQDRPEARPSRSVSMFLVRRARPASRSAAPSTSTAGAPRTPRSSSSTSAAYRRKTCSARKGRASTPSCATSRTSGSCSAPWPWARRRRRSI